MQTRRSRRRREQLSRPESSTSCHTVIVLHSRLEIVQAGVISGISSVTFANPHACDAEICRVGACSRPRLYCMYVAGTDRSPMSRSTRRQRGSVPHPQSDHRSMKRGYIPYLLYPQRLRRTQGRGRASSQPAQGGRARRSAMESRPGRTV